jgi:hypothetical protein
LKDTVIRLFERDTFLLQDFDAKYGINFIIGYLKSRLLSTWKLEYIIKNDAYHKYFQALQAVLAFFDESEKHEITIDTAYFDLLQKMSNLDNINPIIGTKNLSEIPKSATGQVRLVLTELRGILLKNILAYRVEYFLADIENLIDTNFVSLLIDKNSDLFL